MDETYPIYVNRVARMTLPDAYRTQAQHIQASPKYQRQQPGGDHQPVRFPGYTIITPPWVDEEHNDDFYTHLKTLQEEAAKHVSADVLVPLPPESFHLTLADLIWDGAYRHADENPDFQSQLRDRIAQSFEQCRPQIQGQGVVYWQVIGLIMMPRALGVALAPKDETSYEQVLALRRAIYQNPDVIALGIEQQYHFTAHITLGYFGDGTTTVDRENLSQVLTLLNRQWLDTTPPQVLAVNQAELRKFDDMTRFYREPDWPLLQFS